MESTGFFGRQAVIFRLLSNERYAFIQIDRREAGGMAISGATSRLSSLDTLPGDAENEGDGEMRQEDIERGRAWYLKNKTHVERITTTATGAWTLSSEPYHLGGDAHDPSLWLPENWKWFLETHIAS